MMRVMMSCVLFFASCGSGRAQAQDPPPMDTPEFWKDVLVDTVNELDRKYQNVANAERPSGRAFRRSLSKTGVPNASISKLKTAMDGRVGTARKHARTFGPLWKVTMLAFDHGPEILANASVGNAQEATVVLANALSEELVTGAGQTLGAAAGVATLAILGVGGATVAGPVTVAAIAGGALGGWLGAVSAETLYGAYVSDWAKNKTRGIQSYIWPEPDQFEQAVESRKEFLAEEAERTGNRDKESEFYTRLAAIERERESRRQQELAEQSKSFLSAPGADNPDRWKDLESRAKRLAKEAAENPIVKKDADPDTIPVIPEVAVIDAVFTVSNFPIRWSFYLRSGTVKAIMVPFTSPQVDNDVNTVSAGTFKASVDGTIGDNVITGTLRQEPVKFIQKGTDPALPWVRELTYKFGAQNVTITLLPDGVINLSEEEGTYTIDVVVTAGEDIGKTFQVTNPTVARTMTGVWQYRQTAEAAP